MKLVKITWRDAQISTGWMSLEDAKKVRAIEMQTVGWLIDEEEDWVLVSSLSTDEESMSTVEAIPKQWTDEVVEL